MVAIDAMYHTKCIVGFYNRVRQNYSKTNEDQENSKLHAIAFAELVLYIGVQRKQGNICSISSGRFMQMYSSKLEDLGAEQHSGVHATRLKDKLEAELPNLISFKQKNNILLTFNKDMGEAVLKACEHDDDSEALLLARASRIIRRDIFAHKNRLFNGSFETNCQESSVPSSFKALVLMILNGSRTLIDTFFQMGLSISYDRVMSISTDAANSVCYRFEQDGLVCPPKLQKDLFCTAAFDNIDHNSSATTAKDLFHGTAISVVQHITAENYGKERRVNVISEDVPSQKTVRELPDAYRNVPPAVLKDKDPVVPKVIGPVMSPTQDEDAIARNNWLENVKSLYGKDELNEKEFVSWAAFHAALQPPPEHQIDIVALLPLLLENAHSVAMILHGMNVANDVVQHLNPGQIPIIAMDQPLFAIAKQIQWNNPNTLGEDHYVVKH